MNVLGLIALLLVMWIISLAGTAWQLYRYRKALKEFQINNDEGYLGVGMSKSNFKPKKIILLMTDQQGIIKECKIMSGLTIFAGFNTYHKWNGLSIKNISMEQIKPKYQKAFQQASDLITKEMNKKNI